jgi:hypothetical protein
LLPSLLLAACSVGTFGEEPVGGDAISSTDDRDICVDKVAAPAAGHQHTAIGAGVGPQAAGPRSGVGCMAPGGCHGAQPGSTQYAFAGTAYGELGGTTPLGGVTVRIFKAGTKKSVGKAVTDAAGNFYITGTFTDFPYETDITGCGSNPDIIPMISPIRANEANCASSDACHIVPGPRAVYLTP